MKQGFSEIVFILDMTGSMQSIAAETVIGFNNFLEEQRKVPGDADITLVVFNSNKTEHLYSHVALKDAKPLQASQYRPDGMTPLMDTIGNTIQQIGERLKNTAEENRPEHVIVAIMTDGEENFSHKFDHKTVFDMVKHQQDVYKWNFVFLGANQDSYLEAGRLGIDAKDIKNYQANAQGVRSAYVNMSASVADYRTQS